MEEHSGRDRRGEAEGWTLGIGRRHRGATESIEQVKGMVFLLLNYNSNEWKRDSIPVLGIINMTIGASLIVLRIP